MARKTNTATLTPQQQARANVEKKVKDGIGVTRHTSGAPIKGLSAQPAPKPTSSNMRTIAKLGTHPGNGNCIKRWHLYREGMTLRDCVATAGLTPNDVTFWAKCGYLKLRPATQQELAAAQAAYAKAQGKAQPAKAQGAAGKPQRQAQQPAKAQGKAKPQRQAKAAGKAQQPAQRQPAQQAATAAPQQGPVAAQQG